MFKPLSKTTILLTTLLMVSACGESTLESEHVLVRNHTDLAHLYGITSIQGDVSIMADDVTSLIQLELTQIDGDLIISHTASLIDLSGLDNLVTVTGRVTIGMNDSLQTLNGLSNLQEVGEFWINGNPSLASLQGTQSLEAVRGDVVIWQNERLENLSRWNPWSQSAAISKFAPTQVLSASWLFPPFPILGNP